MFAELIIATIGKSQNNFRVFMNNKFEWCITQGRAAQSAYSQGRQWSKATFVVNYNGSLIKVPSLILEMPN